MSVKRVDRVGPVIDFSTPDKALRDIRRAADHCENCGRDVEGWVDDKIEKCTCKRTQRRDP